METEVDPSGSEIFEKYTEPLYFLIFLYLTRSGH